MSFLTVLELSMVLTSCLPEGSGIETCDVLGISD